MDAAAGNGWLHLDRRRRARLLVNWPLVVGGSPGTMVETVTHDLSSDGFYCLAGSPFVPGEVQICTLSVPAYNPDDLTRVLAVQCRVLVVRVEALAKSGLFGIGCRIEDYHVYTSAGTSCGVPVQDCLAGLMAD